jgi:NAD(P)-dependent dehydrogenase (short-subunit alcohol dehydrogenase family)
MKIGERELPRTCHERGGKTRGEKMDIAGKVAIVTGAASGIGFALATGFVREGAKAVVLADLPQANLEAAAATAGGHAIACDVTDEHQVNALIEQTEQRFGSVDIFISNAGIVRFGDEHAANGDWAQCWNLHVMAHVYAARNLMPKMARRGSGYFLISASAAGLLSHINSATYATTKHAAIAFAEYLSIAHGDQGIRVAVLCPQQVRTPMTQSLEGTVSSVDGRLEPEDVVECVLAAMRAEVFLILPHPKVLTYLQRKTENYEGWLQGMRKLKAQFNSLT